MDSISVVIWLFSYVFCLGRGNTIRMLLDFRVNRITSGKYKNHHGFSGKCLSFLNVHYSDALCNLGRLKLALG